MEKTGFFEFDSVEARDRFFCDVGADRPSLRPKLTLSKLRPIIIAKQLSDEEFHVARRVLGNQGKWFEDIQFESTDS